jgi:hypothetical protein
MESYRISTYKGGPPYRAEVTDSVMDTRAELGRMEKHRYRKTWRLRKLRVYDVNGSRSRRPAIGDGDC